MCVDRENITGMGFATVGSDWISHMCVGYMRNARFFAKKSFMERT